MVSSITLALLCDAAHRTYVPRTHRRFVARRSSVQPTALHEKPIEARTWELELEYVRTYARWYIWQLMRTVAYSRVARTVRNDTGVVLVVAKSAECPSTRRRNGGPYTLR
jgi:hypothetical protein